MQYLDCSRCQRPAVRSIVTRHFGLEDVCADCYRALANDRRQTAPRVGERVEHRDRGTVGTVLALEPGIGQPGNKNLATIRWDDGQPGYNPDKVHVGQLQLVPQGE
jgi:hypothetical protein